MQNHTYSIKQITNGFLLQEEHEKGDDWNYPDPTHYKTEAEAYEGLLVAVRKKRAELNSDMHPEPKKTTQVVVQ